MNDKVKIIIAVTCLGLAVVAIAWQMGAFSSGAKGAANPEGFDAALDVPVNEVQGENVGGATYVPPTEPGGRGGVIITGN